MTYTIQIGNRTILVDNGHWTEIGRVTYTPSIWEELSDGWHMVATADLKQPPRPKDRRAKRTP